jgi:hypothetical protein
MFNSEEKLQVSECIDAGAFLVHPVWERTIRIDQVPAFTRQFEIYPRNFGTCKHNSAISDLGASGKDAHLETNQSTMTMMMMMTMTSRHNTRRSLRILLRLKKAILSHGQKDLKLER